MTAGFQSFQRLGVASHELEVWEIVFLFPHLLYELDRDEMRLPTARQPSDSTLGRSRCAERFRRCVAGISAGLTRGSKNNAQVTRIE